MYTATATVKFTSLLQAPLALCLCPSSSCILYSPFYCTVPLIPLTSRAFVVFRNLTPRKCISPQAFPHKPRPGPTSRGCHPTDNSINHVLRLHIPSHQSIHFQSIQVYANCQASEKILKKIETLPRKITTSPITASRNCWQHVVQISAKRYCAYWAPINNLTTVPLLYYGHKS